MTSRKSQRRETPYSTNVVYPFTGILRLLNTVHDAIHGKGINKGLHNLVQSDASLDS